MAKVGLVLGEHVKHHGFERLCTSPINLPMPTVGLRERLDGSSDGGGDPGFSSHG